MVRGIKTPSLSRLFPDTWCVSSPLPELLDFREYKSSLSGKFHCQQQFPVLFPTRSQVVPSRILCPSGFPGAQKLQWGGGGMGGWGDGGMGWRQLLAPDWLQALNQSTVEIAIYRFLGGGGRGGGMLSGFVYKCSCSQNLKPCLGPSPSLAPFSLSSGMFSSSLIHLQGEIHGED